MSKELREAIRKHRTWSESVVLGTTLKHKRSNLVTDDELLALFDRYAEQREKQARIDERECLMKPKTIQDVLDMVYDLGRSDEFHGDDNWEDDGRPKALSQIQQLLEECAPEEKKFTYSDIYGDDPRNNYGYGEERYRDGATYGYAKSISQYKSNIRGKLK